MTVPIQSSRNEGDATTMKGAGARPSRAFWRLWNGDDDRGWRGERPWPAGREKPGQFPHAPEEFSAGFLKREARLVVAGVVGIVLLAALFALVLFAGAPVLPAVLVLVAYIGLLTTPVWMAALADDAEDHAGEWDEPAR